MRRTVMFITAMLAVAGLALPATAAPPDGVPPSSPPGQGGERPSPPGGGGSGGGGAPPGTPGSPVSLGIADAFVSEGSTAQVTIAADAAPSRDVTVDWATEDWTATAPDDYTAASGTAVIPAGETTATVAVSTVDDELDEGDRELLRVVLSNPSANASLGDSTAVVTIVDDDEPPPPSGECGVIGQLPYPDGGAFHVPTRTVDAGACEELTLVGMPVGATVDVVLTSHDAASPEMEMVLGEVATVGTPTPSGQTLRFTKQGEGEPVLYVHNTTAAGISYELFVQDVTPA